MTRDFHREARQQSAMANARQKWVRQRIDVIHGVLTAYDVLRGHGISLQQGGDDLEEQIQCPFHGADNKPSARIYPASTERHSHVWCYVCQKQWDGIGLWRMFNGEGETTFTKALSEIERAYGLSTPEMPQGGSFEQARADAAMEAFQSRHEVCERRLSIAREDYRRLDDLDGYLMAGSVLDRVAYRVRARKLSPQKAHGILKDLQDKIGDRVRS